MVPYQYHNITTRVSLMC